MNRKSMQKLRLDRRLIRRPGWLTPAEVESEVDALPDVAHKATTLGEAEDETKPRSEDSASPA